MERSEFAALIEDLVETTNDYEYIISLFASEVSKMSLSIEHKLDFLDALFNKCNNTKEQNFDNLSETIKWYFIDHQATPKSTQKFIFEAKKAHESAQHLEQEVKRQYATRRSPRLLAKLEAEQEEW